MATTIQTLFNQANSAITGIDASLITLQEQSDEFNVVTAVANTTIPTANGNVSSTSSTAAYYNKAESDTLYLSTSGGTVTGNITATGFFYANGVSVGGGSGGVAAVNGVVDLSATAYSSLILPTGTYAQRPAAAANGAIRWNSSNNWAEMYTGSSTGWVVLAYGGQYTVNYLIVAGGGGGGETIAGGGGAGGVVYGTKTIIPGTSYSVSVGAGGAGQAGVGGYPTNAGSRGVDSSALAVTTALGGGGGASYNSPNGTTGGSGGGIGAGGSVSA